MGEFKMKRIPASPQNDAVKARMIGERSENFKFQRVGIEAKDLIEIVGRARNTHAFCCQAASRVSSIRCAASPGRARTHLQVRCPKGPDGARGAAPGSSGRRRSLCADRDVVDGSFAALHQAMAGGPCGLRLLRAV